jgi:D-alanyl-D-alanine carboxypeptidase/D-alanyl-D-alanine-endopeptidase (penicillin-binding protein 4)
MLRHRARVFTVFFLALLLCVPAASMSGAPASAPAKKKVRKKPVAVQIREMLSQPQLARAHWGIQAVDLATGKTFFSLNADQLFLPASNAKLFTTAAVLAVAGPAYRFHTTVEAAAKPDDQGRLAGDLVIVGRGDPNISGRVMPYQLKTERVPPHTQVLEDLADQVARSGVKTVSGDLVADDTFYAGERFAPGWAQDDLQWIDGAPVSALSFNDNVVFVNIQPGAQAGDPAVISVEPDLANYQIDNRIVTTPPGIARKIGIHRDIGSKTITLWGSLPADDHGMKEPLAMEDPAEFTAQLFRTLLERRGITIAGKARARHADVAQFFDLPVLQNYAAPAPPVPESAAQSTPPTASAPSITAAFQGPPPVVLAEHVSLPLIEDVRVTNKTSQNLHAELAFRLVGKLGGFTGSFEGGTAAMKQFLLQAGLKEEEFVLLDGSGLSRRDLATPAAVVQLLRYAAQQPWGALYESSLPVSAVDGSLSERFVNTPAAGLIHAKTGTLSHVNALSGYGQTLRGRRFAFSIFCNNHNLGSAKILPVMDSIVQLLVTEGRAVKR